MDFKTLFESAADQNSFIARPPSSGSDASENEVEIASQQQQAEAAMLQYCSFPEVRRHPRQAAIEAHSRTWLANLYNGRLPSARVKRLLATRLDTLGCVVYPHGSSDARSLTLNKLIHWFFVLDDVVDDPHLLGHDYEAARRFTCRHFKAMFGSDVTAMQAVGLVSSHADVDIHDGSDDDRQFNTHNRVGTAPASNEESDLYTASQLAKAQQELVIDIGVQWAEEMHALGMSQRQLERLREAVAEYLAGIVGVVRLRQEKRLPQLDEYIQLRRKDGAYKLGLLGCEFDLGIELDEQTLEHPLIRELQVATADQLFWLNDLLSFNREYHNEDYVSLLAVLHYNKSNADDTRGGADQKADFQETIHEARAMIKAIDQERIRLASEITTWKPELQSYVDATHFAISGSTFWTLWSQRYQSKGPI